MGGRGGTQLYGVCLEQETKYRNQTKNTAFSPLEGTTHGSLARSSASAARTRRPRCANPPAGGKPRWGPSRPSRRAARWRRTPPDPSGCSVPGITKKRVKRRVWFVCVRVRVRVCLVCVIVGGVHLPDHQGVQRLIVKRRVISVCVRVCVHVCALEASTSRPIRERRM